MKNIDLFDDYTARILAEAFEAFPVKRTIRATTLCGHGEIDGFGQVVDASGQPSKFFEIAHATLVWLLETGYLRGEIHPYGLENAVLTTQGLAVLKAVPGSLEPGEATGEKLARLVRQGSFDVARDVVKTAISAGARMALGGNG